MGDNEIKHPKLLFLLEYFVMKVLFIFVLTSEKHYFIKLNHYLTSFCFFFMRFTCCYHDHSFAW